jgi:hypothetical protein
MASFGLGNYVVIVLNVKGSNASHIKLVLQRDCVSLVLVELGFHLVRFYPTKSMSTLPSVSYMRKLALF